jgi:DNA-directed RNA polymerase subunit RPC12/RpoP
MARVIRRLPPPAEHVARHTCMRCGSEVEYERSDMWHGDQRDPGSWVACPVCKATIDATKLTWKPKD